MPNRFKYNGNEEQTDFDWNVYDFNARGYDAVLGRFMQVDPLSDSQESFNPYHFGYNDPIFWNDPTGLCPICETDPEKANNLYRVGAMIYNRFGNYKYLGNGRWETIEEHEDYEQMVWDSIWENYQDPTGWSDATSVNMTRPDIGLPIIEPEKMSFNDYLNSLNTVFTLGEAGAKISNSYRIPKGLRRTGTALSLYSIGSDFRNERYGSGIYGSTKFGLSLIPGAGIPMAFYELGEMVVTSESFQVRTMRMALQDARNLAHLGDFYYINGNKKRAQRYWDRAREVRQGVVEQRNRMMRRRTKRG